EMADHDFAVDQVLGAAERDEADLDHDERGARRAEFTTKKPRRRPRSEAWRVTGLFLLGRRRGGFPALEIGGAAFTFDDFVVLLSHGERGKESRPCWRESSAPLGPERLAALHPGAVAPPAVDPRSGCAIELLEQRGIVAFLQRELGDAAGIAVEKAGKGLEMLRPADDARQAGGRSGTDTAVENEEAVGQAAQIDPGAPSKFHPGAVGKDFRRRRSKVMAPVAFAPIRE